MRLLVFGSRGWPLPYAVFSTLDAVWTINRGRDDYEMHIIAGGAKGPDVLAEQWADENRSLGVTKQIFIADWAIHGRKAGWVRNNLMVDEGRPTHALGFWDGKSKGTGMMIDILARVKIPRRIITPDVAAESNVFWSGGPS